MSRFKWTTALIGSVLLGGCAQNNPSYYSSRRAVLGRSAPKVSAPAAPQTNAPPPKTFP